MANPRAAMLVIGDEILSGRTRDSNLHYLAQALRRAGIDLVEARVVADDHAAIVGAVRALSASVDHVFTSGGIGRPMTTSPPMRWPRRWGPGSGTGRMRWPCSGRITTGRGWSSTPRGSAWRAFPTGRC